MATPPPQPRIDTATPEQIRRRELNRLKAKERQRQRLAEESRASSDTLAASTNVNGKRVIASGSGSTYTVPRIERDASSANTAPKPLPKDTRLIGKYVEYDLSKMINRKGGFLVEDDKEVDEDFRRKEMQRERERMLQNVEPPIIVGAYNLPKCRECESVHIDPQFQKVFGCLVCNRCKDEKPEKYSLLTKTECKEDYLLTDPELRDHELLPHLLKANPHSTTWNNMMLFLRYQIEDYAFKVKWGSEEKLDAEYERRAAMKKDARQKKFQKDLRQLRKRTKESIWQDRRDQDHVHEFGVVERTGPRGQGVQRCMTCSFEVEVEEM